MARRAAVADVDFAEWHMVVPGTESNNATNVLILYDYINSVIDEAPIKAPACAI